MLRATTIAVLFIWGLSWHIKGQITNYISAKATVTGYIANKKTGEQLAGANISLANSFVGTSADSSGHFKLRDINPGIYTITVTHLGYKRFTKEVILRSGDNKKINIELQPRRLNLEEVVIQSTATQKENRQAIGYAHLNSSFLNSFPSVFQTDIFRSLQLLPGITSASDFSSGLFIRGGSPDQTLILFDGAPIYNPSHFFGFYSAFNPSAVKDVSLYKGNYPSKYGGRLGSVLSVSSLQGNKEKTGGEVSLGMLAASASVNGPAFSGKGSWMIAARRSTLDPALGILRQSYEDIPKGFYLLDFNGRFDLQVDPSNEFGLTFYSGMDHLQFPFAEDAGIDLHYGNQIISSSWRHIFSNKVITKFNISGSRYFNYPTYDAASTVYHRSNNIYDLSLRSDTETRLSDRHQLLTGFVINNQTLRLQDQYDGNTTLNSKVNVWNISAYIEHQWELTENITFTPGLRINRYGARNNLLVEPRASLSYRPDENITLQAAFGRNSQNLTLVSDETFSGLDVWMASNEDVPPARGNQYALGVKTVPHKGYKFDLELYYRSMSKLFEPDPLLLDEKDVPYNELFQYGKGYAYGAEVTFKRNIGKLNGFIAYTYSKTRRKFTQVSNQFYPTNFDFTHNLNVALEYKLNASWSVTSVFSYTNGRPYTKPVGRTYYFPSPLSAQGKYKVVPGKKNGARMPAYHRLDLGVTRKGEFLGVATSKLDLQILNVYSNRNVWFYHYDLEKNANYKENVQLLPLLPSISYSIYF